MAYLIDDDLRAATVHEAVAEFILTDEEASPAALTAAIARASQRLNEWTDDRFESGLATFQVRGSGTANLTLPQRCTAVTSVNLRASDATLTLQAATSYRLVSSLLTGGAVLAGAWDRLELIPNGPGLTGSTDAYAWPIGPQTVQVIGTFGWTTTPPDIKRVVGFMVHDHFKSIRPSLRVAESVQTDTFVVRYPSADPLTGTFTGAPEVDDIINRYRRIPSVLVG